MLGIVRQAPSVLFSTSRTFAGLPPVLQTSICRDDLFDSDVLALAHYAAMMLPEEDVLSRPDGFPEVPSGPANGGLSREAFIFPS